MRRNAYDLELRAGPSSSQAGDKGVSITGRAINLANNLDELNAGSPLTQPT